ncbi:hypothetical protein TNCV_1550011 [Trichonephila clavipes]|nr:hypothetical protein TNCV_1550011 [Trichonephila clavipes]
MADCEVEGTIASPLSIPLERAMSPTEERRGERRNMRTRQNPFGPQERQTRISKAKIQRVKTGGPSTLQRRNRQRKPQRRNDNENASTTKPTTKTTTTKSSTVSPFQFTPLLF